MVFGLAAALLLVTCAVVTGGLLAYFRGKDGPKMFTLQASVGGQALREEVEFDRRSGTAVYRDVGSTTEGEIVQTMGGLLVLYWQGGCYLLEKNGTRELDIGSAEAAVEALAADPVPRLEVSEIVFLNKSVPIRAEDDVTLRAELPPICGDARLFRVQEEDAPDVEVLGTSVGERGDTDRTKRTTSFGCIQLSSRIHCRIIMRYVCCWRVITFVD
ncbi:uncharacterized protein LOC144881316 isoform X2 [Branchiostoma floridae x Branchiostoma japonicum]